MVICLFNCYDVLDLRNKTVYIHMRTVEKIFHTQDCLLSPHSVYSITEKRLPKTSMKQIICNLDIIHFLTPYPLYGQLVLCHHVLRTGPSAANHKVA